MRLKVQEAKTRLHNEYDAFARYQLDKLSTRDIPGLNEMRWLPFQLEELFEIKPGKRLVARDMTPGKDRLLAPSITAMGCRALSMIRTHLWTAMFLV